MMKKRKTYPAIAAAFLMIGALIGFGILLAAKYQSESLPSDADYQMTQLEAGNLLDELAAITGTENSADSVKTSSSTDGVSSKDTNNPDATAGLETEKISDTKTKKGTVDQTNTEVETEPDTEWILELLALDDTPVIWVGDSRTVGMQKALGSYTNDVFVGAAGEGYTWLSETGVARLETAIAEFPGRPVIFNMGVNDYENLYNYMVLYEELTAKYPNTVFWFLSINPVDNEAGLYITNRQIEEFNASLAAAYPDTWLDSYTFLAESDAGTIDGIHYSEEVYRMIYLFVKEALSDKA